MKISSLIFVFVVFITFSGCENPMMYQILEPKTITFDTNGGSPVQSQNLFKNEKITEPQEPKRGEYKFIGWYTDNASFSERWNFNNIPKGDMTLYAAWNDTRKPTPILENFIIEGLTHIFNGDAKEVTITPLPGKSDGLITIYYNNEKTAPREVGSYEVTFTVEETDDWNRAAIEAGTMKIAIDNIEYFSTYLEKLPNNPADTPYTIPLSLDIADTNIYDLLDVLRNNEKKYVNLDLSGSTFLDDNIPDEAFVDCTSLTGITIPNNVTSIASRAFEGCTSLTSVIIPNSVTSIGSYAFGCTSLASVTIPNSVTSIGDGAFNSCNGLTSVIIPNSVTIIGEFAFYGCESLTSVIIPNSVTIIRDQAFQNCESLTSVIIPNSVTSIGNYVFENCASLTSVTIPNSVTSIGASAFEYCTSLTSVTIPGSVIKIDNNAFNTTSLITVKFEGTFITGTGDFASDAFLGNLVSVYIDTNNSGGPGTYTRTGNAPFYYWTKQ